MAEDERLERALRRLRGCRTMFPNECRRRRQRNSNGHASCAPYATKPNTPLVQPAPHPGAKRPGPNDLERCSSDMVLSWRSLRNFPWYCPMYKNASTIHPTAWKSSPQDWRWPSASMRYTSWSLYPLAIPFVLCPVSHCSWKERGKGKCICTSQDRFNALTTYDRSSARYSV